MHSAILASTFLLLSRPFAAASLTYCATENTGASFQAVSNLYQSNGACAQTCAGYALGILQGKECWCSNVAPAVSAQKSIGDCSTGCPGYPKDSCGSAAMGVFAYVKIPGKQVTTTAGGGGSTTTNSPTGASTMTTSSSATASPSTAVSSSMTSTTSQPPLQTSQTTSSSDTTTTTGSVVKETTAAGGVVKTITVSAPNPTSPSSGLDASAASTSNNAHTSSKLSGGSIAGIVIGVIAGLALLGALIFLVFFYRKRARAASPVPSQDMADRTSQGSSFAPYSQTHAADFVGASTLGRKQTFTDNRLKPNIYPNGPRDSSVSLQDNEDYSRPVLRLTNPD